MKKVVFASANKGKVSEVNHILDDLELNLVSLADMPEPVEIIEDGNSFEENAIIKAVKVFEKFNVPVIADDSGLVVEQLNGAPGIYSARYAGDDSSYAANNKKLLKELIKHPEPHSAKFVCAAVYYDGKESITALGEFKGRIIDEERGANGFGYDPLFIPDGYSITLAEMEPGLKNRISHRYIAFKKLKNILSQ